MDSSPSLDLLRATHTFPGPYRIKAIGLAEGGFELKVVEATVVELSSPTELDYTVKSTESGRHVSVTLDVLVQSAEQVQSIYAKIRTVEGLCFLI